MATVSDIQKKYRGKIDYLDLELIIAHATGKSREFILSHPEYELAKSPKLKVESYLSRRIKCEPLAYILGEKEFYGLKFKVDKNTLVPRPETEMMIDLVLHKIKNGTRNKKNKIIIADVGTGSGNIIIALAHELFFSCHSRESGNPEKNKIFGSRIKCGMTFYGIDISKKALDIAEQNAKTHKLDKKINFLHGNLLKPLAKKCSKFHDSCSMIIVANLPYLSPKIYASCSKDIKKYEPKSALISQKEGLAHYKKLLEQILALKQNCSMLHVSCFMEISPEQKNKINKLVKNYFPPSAGGSKIIFHKDLAGKWRVCKLEIFNY